MADFAQLIGGYRAFKVSTFMQYKDMIGHVIRQGLKPTTMFICCSDLRISPEIIFSGNPGDFFTVRNMAGLVPPFDHSGVTGVVSAIDYGVRMLGVETIIVLGHAKCHGVRLLMEEKKEGEFDIRDSEAMKTWLGFASEAKEAVNRELADKPIEERCQACEQETILVSLRNLLSYPFVEERLENNQLKLYGWYFNIEEGELWGFNPESRYFELMG